MNSSRFPFSNRQQIFKITNDLSSLLAIGTLNFINIPHDAFDLNGIKVNWNSSWKWLDLCILELLEVNSYNPIWNNLRFLINTGYCKATFKVFRARHIDFPICKVRLYAVPTDIDGYRFINDWRLKLSLKLHTAKKYKTFWYQLLPLIDFNHKSWTLLDGPMILIDSRYISAPTWKNGDEIKRWINQESFIPSSNSGSYSFVDTVKRIYNSVQPPDLSTYINQLSVDKIHLNADELIVNVLNSHKIDGVTTQLYPYQIRSVLQMFKQETIPRAEILSNFISLHQVNNSKPYYYDVSMDRFYSKPQLYQLPKGGILAENMGLGKTLICLSLICLTKFDMPSIPTDILLYDDNSQNKTKLKSLAELCATSINQKSLPWKIYTDELSPSIVHRLEKPGFFKIPLRQWTDSMHKLRSSSMLENNQINAEGTIYKTIYLSNSTLIIVPDNLFSQWVGEIRKHLSDGFLNKLFVSSQIKDEITLPHAKYSGIFPRDPFELLKYDLVLATTTSLSKAQNSGCNSMEALFWKRLIIDEGHSVNSKSSRISYLCESILSERRWAVSGTPTSGLTNLYMDEDLTEGHNTNHNQKRKYIVKNQFSEKADLIKLGAIVGNFLRLEPYHLQPKLWNLSVVKPVELGAYGSDVNLINLLNHVMVRHVQVDMDIQLPQLHHEVVFIEPSLQNKLAVNLFTAVLAVNAVSSERTGVDYMFDSSNKRELSLLITNLQRATFHWTGFKQHDIESLIDVCNTYLEKQRKTNMFNSYDVELLKKSIEISKFALNSARWRTSSLVHEMNYYVIGMGKPYVKYFGIGSDRNLAVFGAAQINAVQEFVYKNRLTDTTKDKLDELSKIFWQTYWRDNVKRNEIRFNRQDSNLEFGSRVSAEQIENSMNTPKIAMSKVNHKKVEESNFIKPPISMEDIDAETLSFKSNKDARILGTASAKLSYLGSRLLEHRARGIKSLVFFEFEDSAYHLLELLDVLGVPYILYANFIKPAARAKSLSDFTNYHGGGISLIMDLKLAAHGLTIIAATHVYFINPVWKKSLEAQAIKRAHRIGQTKDVYVETLILKDTLEEEIYKQSSQTSGKFLMDNLMMQKYILQHNFLTIRSDELEYVPFIAPTNINERLAENDDPGQEYTMGIHSDQVNFEQGSMNRQWDVRVFTSDNLEKINQVKAKKLRGEMDLNELIDENEREIENGRKLTKVTSDEPRKRVRF